MDTDLNQKSLGFCVANEVSLSLSKLWDKLIGALDGKDFEQLVRESNTEGPIYTLILYKDGEFKTFTIIKEVKPTYTLKCP